MAHVAGVPALTGIVLALMLGLTPASAQSLYTSTPGAFVAAETFGLQAHSQNDLALGAEAGYRFGNGFDLSLGMRHAASQITELDFGRESTTWEIRPAVSYHHPLGSRILLRAHGVLNVRFYQQVSGGFNSGVLALENRRLDAELSALLVYRMRLGDRLDIIPGAGLYDTRTLEDKTDAPCEAVFPEACSLIGYGFEIRSTGVQFALPVALRFGERSLVLSPTLRYALRDTYQILERVVDVSLRFNF